MPRVLAVLAAAATVVAALLTAGTALAADPQPTPLPAPPGSAAEPNGTAATATPIDAGERIRAEMTAGDVDRYCFTAAAGDICDAGGHAADGAGPGRAGNDSDRNCDADGGAGCAWLVSQAK